MAQDDRNLVPDAALAIVARALNDYGPSSPEESSVFLPKIAQALGVERIIRRPLQCSASGTADGMLVPKGDGYVIAINDNAPQSRQMYSLAHEIGHLMIQRYAFGQGTSKFRGGPGSHQDRDEERLCEAIAAELLMPREVFGKRLNTVGQKLSSVPILANEFKTSITSTAIRYNELLPTASLLVKWSTNRQRQGWLRSDWAIRNKVVGPYVQIPHHRNQENGDIFEGVNRAWSISEMKTTSETLMLSRRIGSSNYLEFPGFRTESMAFGRGLNRFVLSAVYLEEMQSGIS